MQPTNEIRIRAYVRLIRSSEALHAEVSRGLAAEGLTASQFSTLKVLMIHGQLAQRDIAKHILKSGGNITFLVDNLEMLGYVKRERDTRDRRIVYVSLTEAGTELFSRIYPGHLDRIREATSALSDGECEQLLTLLLKVQPEIEESRCHPQILAGTPA